MLSLLALELAFVLLVDVARERHDAEWCKRKFIGRARSKLASKNVVAMSAALPTPSPAVLQAEREMGEFLASQCKSCGQCRWAREPITSQGPP